MTTRLKQLRIARGLTQSAMAEMMGMSELFVGYVESGSRRPSLRFRELAAKILNVDEDELFERRVVQRPWILFAVRPAESHVGDRMRVRKNTVVSA